MLSEPPELLVLQYSNGRLELRVYESLGNSRVWAAFREGNGAVFHMLCSAQNLELLQEMRRNGFDVMVGSAAERVMNSLVKLRLAEKLPDSVIRR